MPYPIRPVGPEEFAAFRAVSDHVFYRPPPTADALEELLRRFELDRSLAAFDGDRPVGIAGAWTFRLCVPGAMAPAAGVTWVAVLPTHQRRGILSSLMRRQLADIGERGEAIALLWSSEVGIYGRYGYGPASWQTNLTFGRGDGALTRRAMASLTAAAGRDRLRLRITDPESVRAELGKVYQTVLPTTPGMFARNEHWWNRALGTMERGLPGASPLRCVLAEDDAAPRGYALYTGQGRWDDQTFLADSALDVRELVASDPEAAAALWADLLSRDLVTEFKVRLRPADDPLWHLLADGRRSRPRVRDGLWVRLVDVPRALAQRRYACPVDVILNVTDEACPQNHRRWHLTAPANPSPADAPSYASAGALPGFAGRCEPTAAPADITLDVSSLGAAYLGGTRLGTLASAGLVTEHRPGALAALSTAMSWDPAPWCPMIF
jgi:predicted acetyltransferase